MRVVNLVKRSGKPIEMIGQSIVFEGSQAEGRDMSKRLRIGHPISMDLSARCQTSYPAILAKMSCIYDYIFEISLFLN